MYTKNMHNRIKNFTNRYYGQSLLTENKFSQKEVSVADISELLDEIERLENELISIVIDNERVPTIEDIQWAEKIIEEIEN